MKTNPELVDETIAKLGQNPSAKAIANALQWSEPADILAMLARRTAVGAAGAPIPGATGPKGDAGPKGDTGDVGPSGAQGEQGPPGPQGPKGDTGDTGPTGTQGPSGAAGAQGERGVKGDTGDTGAAGQAGATGQQGPKGDKGDTGSQGAQGPQGEPGPTGATGQAGAAGAAANALTAWPVGSVFIGVVATSPATLLGGGTWARIADGRMLVSQSADTDFDTARETGGAKTVTLTAQEIPAHTHVQNAHTHVQNSHSHTEKLQGGTTGTTTGTHLMGSAATGGNLRNAGQSTDVATAVNQDATAVNQNTGGGAAHNNLPPYFVVYMWERTA